MCTIFVLYIKPIAGLQVLKENPAATFWRYIVLLNKNNMSNKTLKTSQPNFKMAVVLFFVFALLPNVLNAQCKAPNTAFKGGEKVEYELLHRL